MAKTVLAVKKVRLTHVVITALCIVVAGMGIFGWSYLNRVNPMETFRAVVSPSVPAPRHLVNVYGEGDAVLGSTRSVNVQGNRIYTSDTSKHRVMVFDYNGRYLFKFGDQKQGNWPGLDYPYGLVVANDKIYVADAGLLKVAVFDMNGQFQSYFAEDILKKPINIVYRDGRFYLTDVMLQQVIVLDESGKKLLAIGKYGKEKPGEFNFPNGLALGGDGRIYVADTNNSRIQVFDPQGKFLTAWQGKVDKGQGVVAAPMNIALDRHDNIYVADPFTQRITVLNQKGEVITTISAVSEGDGELSSLRLPSGVFVDGNERLYVSDSGNRRVVVYDLK